MTWSLKLQTGPIIIWWKIVFNKYRIRNDFLKTTRNDVIAFLLTSHGAKTAWNRLVFVFFPSVVPVRVVHAGLFCAEKQQNITRRKSLVRYFTHYNVTWEFRSSRSQRYSSPLSIVCFLLFVGVRRWFPHGAKLLCGWSGASSTLDACQNRPPIRRPVGSDVMCCWAWLQPAGTLPRCCWIMGLVGLFMLREAEWLREEWIPTHWPSVWSVAYKITAIIDRWMSLD